MQNMPSSSRLPRAAIIPTVLALGAVAAVSLRGNAGQPSAQLPQGPPPVQPSQQVLGIQTAFEQVADKLRPSVVFIKSRESAATTSLRSGMQGQESPFSFQFPGFPFGQGGQGGQQFRQYQLPPNQFQPREYASGSGFIIRSDGYILTNDHVVAGADKVTVQLEDGRELVGQVKRDFRSDLAIVKVNATGLPTVQMGDSDKVHVGQWAIAFGAPFGLSDTMTVGVLSSLHREQEIGEGSQTRLYPSLLQTDASINPGNSGGPLCDVYGRVIGINVAIESSTGSNAGVGFAIPANTARYVIDQLITKGVVTRGFLG
ncbi:MAG TPA: trypsin-like peptidase domain-containing protein, partial [Chthonomonadales bacterium]|nr:trypsin-like peptidase domain-containing protein [Chthonomonadales bacterium]